MTVPLYNLTDTWNNGATVFTAILMNVTDSASNAASLLMDLQVASASVASITKGGTLTLTGNNNAKLFLHDSNGGDATLSVTTSQLHVASIGGLDVQNRINWGSGWGQLSGGNSGLVLSQVAGGSGGIVINPGNDKILEQRNSTTAQTLRVYNTYTDSSNYERGIFDWNKTSNLLTIGVESAGTGTLRKVTFIGKAFNFDNAGNATSLNANPLVLQDFTNGGSNIEIFAAADTGASPTFHLNNSGNFKFRSTGILGWTGSSSDASAAYDTGVSRSAAGVLAIGNGTAGDSSACIVAKTKAGAPTTGDVPAGTWALIRDTTNLTTAIYYNNAGALQSVALT